MLEISISILCSMILIILCIIARFLYVIADNLGLGLEMITKVLVAIKDKK